MYRRMYGPPTQLFPQLQILFVVRCNTPCYYERMESIIDTEALIRAKAAFSIDEVSSMTGLSVEALRMRAFRGSLVVVQPNGFRGRRFVKTSEVRRLLDEPTGHPTPVAASHA